MTARTPCRGRTRRLAARRRPDTRRHRDRSRADALAAEHAALWCYSLAVAFLGDRAARRPARPTPTRTASCAARSSSTLTQLGQRSRCPRSPRTPPRSRSPTRRRRPRLLGRRRDRLPAAWRSVLEQHHRPRPARGGPRRRSPTATVPLRAVARGRGHHARGAGASRAVPDARRSQAERGRPRGRRRRRCCRGGTPAGPPRRARSTATPAAASRCQRVRAADRDDRRSRRRQPHPARSASARPAQCARTAARSSPASHGSATAAPDLAVPGGRECRAPARRRRAAAAARRRWPRRRRRRTSRPGAGRAPVRLQPRADRQPRRAARAEQPLVAGGHHGVGPAEVGVEPAERLGGVEHDAGAGGLRGAQRVQVDDAAVGGLDDADRDDVGVGRALHQLLQLDLLDDRRPAPPAPRTAT